jgi:hypothetical protein
MDKPTCETCPYWEMLHQLVVNHCETIATVGMCCIRSVDDDSFPERDCDNFCGQHPQFSAYLESLDDGQQLAPDYLSNPCEHMCPECQDKTDHCLDCQELKSGESDD